MLIPTKLLAYVTTDWILSKIDLEVGYILQQTEREMERKKKGEGQR